MIRYTINFEERMIEPDDGGKWVKHEDVEPFALEQAAQIRADLQEAMIHIRQYKDKITDLEAELDALRGAGSTTNARYTTVIQAARDRLKLLGHSPTCDSRYTATSPDGQASNSFCSCGLDDWMKESGVAYG